MELLYSAGLVLLGFVLIIYLYFKHEYTYFEKRQIPFADPTFPCGNFENLVTRSRSFAEVMKSYYDKRDVPALGMFAFCNPILLLRDPDVIKQCLVKDFSSFHDRGVPIDEEKTPLFGHLFFLTGTKWRNLRAKLSPTFSSGKMKFMFETLTDRTGKFIEYLKTTSSTENINVEDNWSKLTTDIIAACAFGINCNSLENPENEFRKFGIKSTKPSFRLILGMILLNSGNILSKLVKWPLLESDISDYFIEMVKNTIDFREKNNIMKKDFLQLLIDLKNKKLEIEEEHKGDYLKYDDGKSLTELQCAAQAYVFFLGGFGTASSSLTFTVYELIKNPEIQTRLQKEIDDLLEEYGGFTYECINKMTYLEQVIKETLRKYPPLPWLNRMVTKPVDLIWNDKGETRHLEKGLQIWISVYGLHHDPKYFPNPDTFDPERFSEENKNSFPQYAYLPFGEGPHHCIGSRFGMLQTKVGLAIFLHNFNIEICDKTKLDMKFNKKIPMLTFEEPLYVNYVKRNET